MAVHQPIIITFMVMVVLLDIRGTATAIGSRIRYSVAVAGRRGGDGREKIPALTGRTIRGEIRGTADIHNDSPRLVAKRSK